MNKNLIIGIIVAVFAIVLLVVLSKPAAAAAPDTTIQDLGKVLSTGNEKCSKRCRLICKSHKIFRRGKCKRACKADCGKGIDVGQGSY